MPKKMIPEDFYELISFSRRGWSKSLLQLTIRS